MTLDKWVPYRTDNAAIRCRLFCFPHAGGNAVFYRPWRRLVPPEIDLCPIELPGRSARIDEVPFEQISTLVETLCDALQPLLRLPFALFGHSMGAYIAYEAAQRLRSADGRGAVHLFVSGQPAPDRALRNPPLHSLPDRDLLAALSRFGGTPAAVMARGELVAALLPTIRADLALAENYAAKAGDGTACPLTAFGGDDDDSVAVSSLETWSSFTSGAFRLCVFHGGHFYFSATPAALAKEIVRDLGGSAGLDVVRMPGART